MKSNRLEAFSDGVLAILITIMVLELRPPHGADPAAVRALLPELGSYVLSFILLAIYWNNHHHLLQAVDRVDGRVLWANMHLLFWLSLVPAVTAWMGNTRFAPWPVAAYGLVLLLAAVAYSLLTRALLALHGSESVIAAALGNDLKGKISVGLYLAAVPIAFFSSRAACLIFVIVAVIWLLPDRRIEKTLAK
jgi:uncharacterized membrane protein